MGIWWSGWACAHQIVAEIRGTRRHTRPRRKNKEIIGQLFPLGVSLPRPGISSKKNKSPKEWGENHPRNSEKIGQEEKKNQGTPALVFWGRMAKKSHIPSLFFTSKEEKKKKEKMHCRCIYQIKREMERDSSENKKEFAQPPDARNRHRGRRKNRRSAARATSVCSGARGSTGTAAGDGDVAGVVEGKGRGNGSGEAAEAGPARSGLRPRTVTVRTGKVDP